jgi:hypothetical protein
MPYMVWNSLLNSPQPTAAGAALANSTTLTDVSVAPQFTLPANFLQAGSALRFTAYGTYANSGTTPTLLLGIYYGGVAGVALAATSAITTTNTATVAWPWRLEVTTTVRTTGTSGTAMSQGFCDLATSLTAVAHSPVPTTALATVTIDTTAAKAITVGAQWGTAAAANTLTLHGFTIESMGA